MLGFLEIVSALQEVLKNAKIATLFTFFEIRLLEGMSDNNWCWQSTKKEYFLIHKKEEYFENLYAYSGNDLRKKTTENYS